MLSHIVGVFTNFIPIFISIFISFFCEDVLTFTVLSARERERRFVSLDVFSYIGKGKLIDD